MRVDAVHIDIHEHDLRLCQTLADQRIKAWGNRHRNMNIALTPKLVKRINRMGVIGELAVAHYLQLDYAWHCDWTGEGKDDDVHGIQVRATDYGNGCLVTHPDDRHAPYVLVTLAITGHMQVTASLQGWLQLEQCNIWDHWRTDVPYPAYFTPQTALHPINTLTPIKAGSK